MAEMINLILFVCRWKGGPVGAAIGARPTESGITRPTWLNRITALYFAPILVCYQVLGYCWYQTLNYCWWQVLNLRCQTPSLWCQNTHDTVLFFVSSQADLRLIYHWF